MTRPAEGFCLDGAGKHPDLGSPSAPGERGRLGELRASEMLEPVENLEL